MAVGGRDAGGQIGRPYTGLHLRAGAFHVATVGTGYQAARTGNSDGGRPPVPNLRDGSAPKSNNIIHNHKVYVSLIQMQR